MPATGSGYIGILGDELVGAVDLRPLSDGYGLIEPLAVKPRSSGRASERRSGTTASKKPGRAGTTVYEAGPQGDWAAAPEEAVGGLNSIFYTPQG